MYRTRVITTVEFEIEHDEPYGNKQEILEDMPHLTDFAQAFILGDGDMPRIVSTYVIEDEVREMNREEETADQ